MTEKNMSDRIRSRLGVVADAPGKVARKSERGIKPEDENPKNLEDLDDAQLAAELDDATGKVADAVEAVRAITDELNTRLGEEEGADQEQEA